MKTWIKGGLWGLGILISLAIILEIMNVTNNDWGDIYLATSIMLGWFFILLIPVFILGSIIGLIVDKIKSRKIKR